MKQWGRACKEVACSAAAGTLFCLLAMTVFAVFVRAYAPSGGVILAVNYAIKCAAAFVCSMLCIRRERALFKGAAAGILTAVVTMLLFAAIGGGFRVNALFLADLAVGAVLGGAGALCGAKLRGE